MPRLHQYHLPFESVKLSCVRVRQLAGPVRTSSSGSLA